MMNRNIDLEQKYQIILRSILSQHFPSHTKIWVFGSRATGNAKKFSDIDLLINAGSAIPLEVMAKLNQSFEDSPLPYKVDIADANAISKSFLDNIKNQLISLTQSAQG
jgi:predicted nucleotidyltransferase